MSDGVFRGGGLDQDAAIVSGAKLAEAELGGSEVIDAGREVSEFAANQVKLNFVQRSGAGGGTKINLPTRIFSVPGDSGGKVEQLCDCLQIRHRVGFRHHYFRDGGQGSDSGLAHLGR